MILRIFQWPAREPNRNWSLTLAVEGAYIVVLMLLEYYAQSWFTYITVPVFAFVGCLLLLCSRWIRSKVRESPSEALQGAGAIVGIALAAYAVNMYKDANTASVEAQLLSIDLKVIELRNNPEMAAVFFVPEKTIDQIGARRYVESILNFIVGANIPSYSNVKETFDQMYSLKNIEMDADKSKTHPWARLRKAYDMADIVMCQLAAVADFQESGIIDAEKAETWYNYINDVGYSPIFVMAVTRWHDIGYLSRFASEKIQGNIEEDPAIKAVFKQLYPHCLDDSWSLCSTCQNRHPQVGTLLPSTTPVTPSPSSAGP